MKHIRPSVESESTRTWMSWIISLVIVPGSNIFRDHLFHA